MGYNNAIIKIIDEHIKAALSRFRPDLSNAEGQLQDGGQLPPGGNTGSGYTPADHASSHESGGDDQLNLAAVAGELTDVQHGDRGGGDLHALATTLAPGFVQLAEHNDDTAGLVVQADDPRLGGAGGSLNTIEEVDGSPSLTEINTLIVGKGDLSLSEEGVARIKTAGDTPVHHVGASAPVSPLLGALWLDTDAPTEGLSVTIREEDGTPSVDLITTIIVSNGDLVDEGDGEVRIRTASDATITVEEQDGTPSVAEVRTLRVTNGDLVDEGGGVVSIRTAGDAVITVEEQDGTPGVAEVRTIKVSNGDLTDEGGGVVSIKTAGDARITVRDADGTPLVTDVTEIQVDNGTLEDLGSGGVRIHTATSFTVREQDGSPEVTTVNTLIVSNGDLTNEGGGAVRILTASSVPRLTVVEQDGGPSVTNVVELVVGNSDLTNLGDGSVRIKTAADVPVLAIQEQDGTPNVSPVVRIKVSNGDMTDEGSGVISLRTASGASITVEDADGTPSVVGVTTIKVSSGDLIDEGDGVVSIRTGSEAPVGIGVPRVFGGWYFEFEPVVADHQGPTYTCDVDMTVQGIDGWATQPPTGSAAIFDIEYKRAAGAWTTVFSVKPQFNAASSTPTAGTLSVTSLNAGDRVRFNWDQINAIAGATIQIRAVTR